MQSAQMAARAEMLEHLIAVNVVQVLMAATVTRMLMNVGHSLAAMERAASTSSAATTATVHSDSRYRFLVSVGCCSRSSVEQCAIARHCCPLSLHLLLS